MKLHNLRLGSSRRAYLVDPPADGTYELLIGSKRYQASVTDGIAQVTRTA